MSTRRRSVTRELEEVPANSVDAAVRGPRTLKAKRSSQKHERPNAPPPNHRHDPSRNKRRRVAGGVSDHREDIGRELVASPRDTPVLDEPSAEFPELLFMGF
jgi:hypothetical protein